jgi:hypothetical protein
LKNKSLFTRPYLLVVLALALIGVPTFGQTARIVSVNGRVEVQAPGSSSWVSATAGSAFPVGATISTGLRSTATVEIAGARIEVQPLSRMALEELVAQAGQVSTQLSLPVGRVRAEVQAQEGIQQEFRLRSPVSTAAVRGTSFEFDGQNLEVFSGVVSAINNQGQSTNVAQGENTTVVENASPPTPQIQLEQATRVVTTTNPGGGSASPPPQPMMGMALFRLIGLYQNGE